ncbi:TatD family hydrolase, partial [Candidatus Woesebacteria bacterium]|nr:TatD family hydrolase [Candidatus Woesebacteria bacterium]
NDQQPENWKEHWRKATESGVIGSMVVGVDADTSSLAVSLAQTDSRLLAAVGFHPNHCSELVTVDDHYSQPQLEQQLDSIRQHITALCTSEPVAAIGEIGLDYYRLPEANEARDQILAVQQASCVLQINMAAEFELPLILHVRDKLGSTEAHTKMIELLEAHASFAQPFILHCVSGSIEYVRKAVELGGYIGLAGNVTYKSAQLIRDISQSVPTDRLLIETDAPYLAPQAYRGKSCEPWMISETARYLDEELGFSKQQLLENTMRVFPQFEHILHKAK